MNECQRFRDMTPNERWKIVKDQRACFCCLKKGKGHTVANCSRKKDCGEKQLSGIICKTFHHKLLHVDANGSSAQVSSKPDGGGTLLPVLFGQVKEEHGTKTAKVFYDSGAQISMVRKDLVEEMRLEGRPSKIVITKVGGTEEELDTKIYKVPVSTYDGKRVQIVQAVGISHISDDATNINVNRISEIFGIPADQLKRVSGLVDLLIGINHLQFHVGETRIKDGLAVRKSPLGWVAFGVHNEQTTQKTTRVLNVRLAAPVDLSEFWNTESMGVAVSPCQCSPTKLTLQEQKELKLIEESCHLEEKKWTISYSWKKSLEILPDNYAQWKSTKRRLAKTPNHAESCDKQMKEMESIEFSRKDCFKLR